MPSLEELIANARHRNEIASWNDDLTLEPVLAAIYLGVSVKKLEELRGIEPDENGHGGGPPFIKMTNKKSKGLNQSVLYKLGDLRKYQREHTVGSVFEGMQSAGMFAMMTAEAPFFTCKEQEGEERIVASVLDFRNSDERDIRFHQFMKSELDIRYIPWFVAAKLKWTDVKRRDEIRDHWASILQQELDELKY